MANEIHVRSLIAVDMDEQFEKAVRKAGFKSRWDWDSTLPSQDPTGEIKAAYAAKVKADEAVHEAWEASRK